MAKQAILIASLFLASCATPKVVTNVETEYREIVSIIHDTAYVDVTLPPQKIEVIKPDSSHLETDFALTDAWTDSLGLHHTLEHKTTPIPKEVQYDKEIIYRDSLVYKTEVREVEVAAPLSWWQRVRLDGFYILAGLALILGLFLRLRHS